MTRTLVCVTGLRGIPGVMGGVETHCEELLPRIASLAPDLDIEVLGRRGFVPAGPAEYRGVRVRGLFAPKGRSTEAIVSTFLAILHASRRAEVVHIHAIGPALLAPLARLMGLRVVMTHHGSDFNRAKWGLFAKAMLRWGEQLGVIWANQVIAVAPTLTADLKQRFPTRAGAITYIPNGAPHWDDQLPSRKLIESFGLTPKRFILAVGRLVPEKGFDQLVRAFRKSGTTRDLVIVGSDVHGSSYSKLLRSEAGERVHFLGSQPRSILRSLYEQADLFVLPSLHEGLPISALEAASCGTPMLLSNIPPNLDVGLGEANYFAAGDETALAACLTQAGAEFRYDVDRIRHAFDWTKIAEDTLAVYRRAARSSPTC